MKKIILGLYIGILAAFTVWNMGCIAEVHNARWHYDHDYNDEWRSHHAWHENRQDWDH